MSPIKLITGYEFDYPQLGRVRLTVRSNSRSITARWKNGKIQLNIPRGISEQDVLNALQKFTPSLQRSKPALRYHDGQQIILDGLTITIKKQTLDPRKILGQARIPNSVIGVGSEWDFDNDNTTKSVSRLMCKVAQRLAPEILLPHARRLAQNVGTTPLGWSISTGHRVLGKCDSNGFISLSYIIVFLPLHLREYIIYHELAHLSEMNHSSRFHQLCNKYCNGKEAHYINELKAYKWPILR